MDPNTIQRQAGSQPQMMPIAGPTMGPVPAMEVKWCPNMTCLDDGTKSVPSFSLCAGVCRCLSSLNIFAVCFANVYLEIFMFELMLNMPVFFLLNNISKILQKLLISIGVLYILS